MITIAGGVILAFVLLGALYVAILVGCIVWGNFVDGLRRNRRWR